MLEAIGEAAVQQNRAEQSTVVHVNQAAQEKIEKEAKERKVETAEKSRENTADASTNGETRFNLTTNRIVIEKYGKDGQLLLQVPPIHDDQA